MPRTRAPWAGAAQSGRDTGHQEEGGTERGEKDATAPLARHTRARTHTASGQPGGESLSRSTRVCGRPADARGGGAGQVAARLGPSFPPPPLCSKMLLYPHPPHTQTSPSGGFPSLTPLPFAPHSSLAAPTEWSCCRCSQPQAPKAMLPGTLGSPVHRFTQWRVLK